jgi:alpha-tubulin suppressor-like RCC1 family protein
MKHILLLTILILLKINLVAQCWNLIDAGGVHSLAIRNNSLWAWGYNVVGQLGNGNTINTSTPMQIGISTNWKMISGDVFHSLGIKNDGTLWAWGRNHFGQIGDSTFIDKLLPIQIGTDTTWELVSAGYENSYAMKTNKTIWGWGANGYSELGSTASSSKIVPTQIGSSSDWQIIKAGYRDAMAIKSDSTLWMWGWNGWGQIGNGTQNVQSIPFQIGNSKWIEVSGGWSHTLAIKSDGTLWGWGHNQNKKLGDTNYASFYYTSPIQIGTNSDWLKIQAGYSHSVGIKNNGTLWTWGWNGYGQLGDTTNSYRITPKQIGVKNNWKEISTGQHFIMALDDNDSLFTWGLNQYGGLGDGTFINSNVILPIICSFPLPIDESNLNLELYSNYVKIICSLPSKPLKKLIIYKSINGINFNELKSFNLINFNPESKLIVDDYDVICRKYFYRHELIDLNESIEYSDIQSINTSNCRSIIIVQNPIVDFLHLSNFETDKFYSIEIYNLLGNRVMSKSFSKASPIETINLSTITSGVYILKIRSSNHYQTLTFEKI